MGVLLGRCGNPYAFSRLDSQCSVQPQPTLGKGVKQNLRRAWDRNANPGELSSHRPPPSLHVTYSSKESIFCINQWGQTYISALILEGGTWWFGDSQWLIGGPRMNRKQRNSVPNLAVRFKRLCMWPFCLIISVRKEPTGSSFGV